MGRFHPTSKQVAILKEQGVPINDCVKLGKKLNMLEVLRSGHQHQQVLQSILEELLEMDTGRIKWTPPE